MTSSPPPPIAGADRWLPCMEAAGYQCQCKGRCGKRAHERVRCGERHRPAVKLLAVSMADSWIAAATDRNLTAMCPTCHTAMLRLRLALSAAAVTEPEGLW